MHDVWIGVKSKQKGRFRRTADNEPLTTSQQRYLLTDTEMST